MYCTECGQILEIRHLKSCITLMPEYQSTEKKLRDQLKALEVKNNEQFGIMNTLYSLLSLVLHRHLPRNLDSLQKDIEKALATAEPVLRPWWDQEMNQSKKSNVS